MTRISELPDGGAPQAGDQVPAVRGGATRKVRLGTAAGAEVVTSAGDLTSGRVATIDQVRRSLGSHGLPYRRRVILLHPIYDGTLLEYHLVDGKISALRGSVSSFGNAEVCEVTSAVGYDSRETNVYAVETGLAGRAWEPVSCYVGGVKYAALKMPYYVPGYGAGVLFEGRVVGPDPNMLRVIEYYDEQAQAVLDAEVYNSIEPLTVRNAFRIGNYYALHTGDVTASPTDGTVGRVLKVGDFGVGSVSPPPLPGNDCNDATLSGLCFCGSTAANAPHPPPSGKNQGTILHIQWGAGYATQMHSWVQGHEIHVRHCNNGVWSGWASMYHTANTTADGNGHLLVASPIIRLYADRIEYDGNFHQPPQFERLSMGVYRITGTLGLRIDDGWYLETPSDRNGNKYFNVDWEQDLEPENEAGIVDEPIDVVLTIRTYERVWDPADGRYENGAPIDINDLQRRHIALRFNELRRPESTE